MNFDLNNFTTASVVIIPIVIAVTQAFKMTGWIKSQYSPLVAIVIGVFISFIAHHDSADLTVTILNGVLFGLSASGLYSGIQVTQQATAQMKEKQQQKANEQQQYSNDQQKFNQEQQQYNECQEVKDKERNH